MKTCVTCGAADWGTRGRCNPGRARAAREATTSRTDAARAAENARLRKWRADNPRRAAIQQRRARYGLEEDERRRLLAAQSGRCAICREGAPSCVDHDHRSAEVRGLLCRTCNAGLGQFRDDPELLLRAAAYLEGLRP